MPELPEVETNRRELVKKIIGKTIRQIEILHPKQFLGNPQDIVGHRITDLERNGKILSIALTNDLYLNIHLKLTGQLLYAQDSTKAIFSQDIPLADGNKMPAKSTRVIFKFSDNSGLFFNDMRTFGWIKVAKQPEKPKAFDATSAKFTAEYLKSIVSKTKKPIKTLLLEQDKVAGIGNIYANEALFEAGIHPTRVASSLTIEEVQKLHAAIIKILEEGIKYRGSSGKDEIYVLPDGSRGQYQNYFRVYQRQEKPCKKCGTTITRIKQAGRSSFLCPHCQPITYIGS